MLTAKTIESIMAQFEHTTIDQDDLKFYCFNYPSYLELAVQIGCSKHVCNCMAYADGVDFWLRRYLTGHPATLHKPFHEIRSFLAFNDFEARRLIPVTLDHIQRKLLANEWYELMSRYTKARQRIRKTFQL